MHAVVIAAHADDETLGAGGLIQCLVQQNWTVKVIVLTDGQPTSGAARDNRRDCADACEVLGVTPRFLWYRDQRLDTYPLADIAATLESVIDPPPALLVTHAKTDLNRDHQIAFDVGCILARRLVCTVLAAEVPGYASWQGQAFQANFYAPITQDQVERKIVAFECYENECRPDWSYQPWTARNIRATATMRGAESGFAFAEAFQFVRGTVAGIGSRMLV